jgi:N utilization substance protein A
MNTLLIEALKQIKEEKNIDPETILVALTGALETAFIKIHPEIPEPVVTIDRENGEIKVFSEQKDSKGNVKKTDVTPKDFGRVAAQTAKQVILQKIRDVERDMIYEEYADRVGDVITGIIEQSDHRYTLINLGRVEAQLPPHEQVHGERYEHGSRLKSFLLEVKHSTKGPQIVVSRTHPGLLKRLFELEVPEIIDGYVEIVSVAREAGYRSKIAVRSKDANVDPVGACVGPKGSRVRMVVNELRGEKIDVVQYHDDSAAYVAQALSPAKVNEVRIFEEEKRAMVIVPDSQLSLAIGKEGQNARLAAKLTGWRIDIKSESQFEKEVEQSGTESSIVEEPAAGSTKKEEKPGEQCEAITTSGKRCQRKAKRGSKYCATHQKLEQSKPEGEVGV